MSALPPPRTTILDRLERRFGRYAIPHLIHHVAFWCFMGFLVQLADRADLFVLDRQRVAEGEIWRLASHIFLIPLDNPLFALFTLLILMLFGRAVESEWGSFRFNVYYFVGAILTTAAGLSVPSSNVSIAFWYHQALILPFATLYPDYRIGLFFGLLPVRVKWLAYIDAAIMALAFAGGTMGTKIVLLATVANYLLFFWRPFVEKIFFSTRREAFRRKVEAGRAAFFHRCAVCGRTERDDPKLEFRVCPDCQGDHDYCLEHLQAHEHK